ncbi:MAG: hypothetical protein RID53_06620 [Coleofasciculus sp. B1-GNL1-01]
MAIISDIHGNLPRLQAAMADIEACGCHQIVCLGKLGMGSEQDAKPAAWLR